MGALIVTPEITLNEAELHEDFVHSPGPGGQNVNKVATAVRLTFDVLHSPSLPDAVRQRLIHLARKRINWEGVLLIQAHRFRNQEQNRDDARARLVALIRAAAEPPHVRHKTHPSAAARRKRLEAKRQQSQRKRARRSAHPDSD